MLGTRADAGRRLPERIVYRHTLINGEPGLLRYIDGNLEAAMALATDGERIVGIYTVRNPDKLAHIAQRLAPQKAVTNVGDATS